MMSWVMRIVRGVTTEDKDGGAGSVPQMTRQELAHLFVDDLARPALQKRAKPRRRPLGQPLANRRAAFV